MAWSLRRRKQLCELRTVMEAEKSERFARRIKSKLLRRPARCEVDGMAKCVSCAFYLRACFAAFGFESSLVPGSHRQ